MPESLPLRIFLASPGDLEAERQVVRDAVDAYNSNRSGTSLVVFEVVEWSQVRGTARRAQEAINELIDESHFMMVLFASKWGSEPGSPWGYTSGTEEELFTGLLALGQPDHPLRDVWVAFIRASSPEPAILQLRDKMIAAHSMMFEEVADMRDLRSRLETLLIDWEAKARTKDPRNIDLLPSSGIDVLKAANCRLRGEKLIELGLPELGLKELASASEIGGPAEHLAYAKWLRRNGDLNAASATIDKAIAYFAGGAPLHTTMAADVFSAKARILSAEGNFDDAVGRLDQALTLIPSGAGAADSIRCRTYDDLGLAYSKLGDLTEARKSYEAALTLRRAAGNDFEICQSLVNLARLEVREGNLDKAAELAEEVILKLKSSTVSSLHANSSVLMAQIRLRQGRGNEGVSFAEKAVALNRQMGNRKGEAISHLVAAQCAHAGGDRGLALSHANESLRINNEIQDESGSKRVEWFISNRT